MAKINNKKIKKDNKYNADNEIIICVTTKPKEEAKTKRKSTHTNSINTQKKQKRTKENNTKKIKNKNINSKIPNKIKREKADENKKIINIKRRKIIISIIVLLVISIGGTIYLFTTPVFNIINIIVYGNESNSSDTYISLSKINIGNTNIFAVKNKNIKKNLKENAYFEDVYIKRKFPNTLELYITERKASYQIEFSKQYIYLNNQGYILDIKEKKLDIPTLTGLTTVKENIQIGQRVNNDDLIKLDTILKILNYCKYNNIENKITDINVEDVSNYVLNFEKDKKKAYLGDASNLSERILWLKTILQKEKGNSGEIFINGDLNKDKVYFRENSSK